MTKTTFWPKNEIEIEWRLIEMTGSGYTENIELWEKQLKNLKKLRNIVKYGRHMLLLINNN